MPSKINAPNDRAWRAVDWLSPITVMLGTLGVYVLARIAMDRLLAVPLLWGGSTQAEETARSLAMTFVGATAVGVWLSPRRRMFGLEAVERSLPARHVGIVAALACMAAGTTAMVLLVQRLGGLSRVLETQAAWASQIKELGLGPLYGLTYLLVIGCQVFAFRFLMARQRWKALPFFLLALMPALVLGRRIIILFAALPLLAFEHYHVRRLALGRVLLLGSVGLSLFLGILLLRIRAEGTVVEAIATSYEFAPYDALVATVDRSEDLAELNSGYFLRHPDDFWSTNAGALFMQRISGFQFAGGATPPTAVGTLWIYFGWTGVVIGGGFLGFLLGRARLEARADAVGALLYGFILFYWFDFVRGGDIVLGMKLLARYGFVLVSLLSLFYRLRIALLRPNVLAAPGPVS